MDAIPVIPPAGRPDTGDNVDNITLLLRAVVLVVHKYGVGEATAADVERTVSEIVTGSANAGRNGVTVGFRESISGKKGLLRAGLEGLRTGGSARAVIVPAQVPLGCLELPVHFRGALTTEWVVSDATITHIMGRVHAAIVDGISVGVRRGESRRFVLQASQAHFVTGELVSLPLAVGDRVMFNRQPTLTRTSITTFNVVAFTKSYVIGFHPLNFLAFGADCDGDEMNVYSIQSVAGRAEAAFVMHVNLYAAGVRLVQDFAYTVFSLSTNSCFLSRAELLSLIAALPSFMRAPLPAPVVGGPLAVWRGRAVLGQIFRYTHLTMSVGVRPRRTAATEAMLHPRLTAAFAAAFAAGTPGTAADLAAELEYIAVWGPEGAVGGPNPLALPDDAFEITDLGAGGSHYAGGRINGHLAARITEAISTSMSHSATRVTPIRVLSALADTAAPYLRIHPLTVSLNASVLPPNVAARVAEAQATCFARYAAIETALDDEAVPVGQDHRIVVGNALQRCCEEMRGEVTPHIVAAAIATDSPLFIVALAAAKSTSAQIIEGSGFIGIQRFDEHAGLPLMPDEGRSTPWSVQYDRRPLARGFISGAYVAGLGGEERSIVAAASLWNVSRKAADPSTAGYEARCTGSLMMDCITNWYGAVVDMRGAVMQARYGWGVQPEWQKTLPTPPYDAVLTYPEAPAAAALADAHKLRDGAAGSGWPAVFKGPVDMHAHITSCTRGGDEGEEPMLSGDQVAVVAAFFLAPAATWWSMMMRAYVRYHLLKQPLSLNGFEAVTSSLLAAMDCAKVPNGEPVGLRAAHSATSNRIQGVLKLVHSTGGSASSTGKLGALLNNTGQHGSMVVGLEDSRSLHAAIAVSRELERVLLSDLLLSIDFWVHGVDPADAGWLADEALVLTLLGAAAGSVAPPLAIRVGFDAFQVARRMLTADSLRRCFGLMAAKWGRWLYDLVDRPPAVYVRQDGCVGYFMLALCEGERRALQLPRIAAEIRKWQYPVRGHAGIAAARVVRRWDEGEYAVVTDGSALGYVMGLPGVDTTRTWSTVPYEMECVLGVLGGRASLAVELAAASDMAAEHIELIAGFVTRTGSMVGFTWNDHHKIRDDIWSVAVFERPIDVFATAALYGAVDDNKSVNASVIKGDVPRMGTGAVDLCIAFTERNAAGGTFAGLPDATFQQQPQPQLPPPPPPPPPPAPPSPLLFGGHSPEFGPDADEENHAIGAGHGWADMEELSLGAPILDLDEPQDF